MPRVFLGSDSSFGNPSFDICSDSVENIYLGLRVERFALKLVLATYHEFCVCIFVLKISRDDPGWESRRQDVVNPSLPTDPLPSRGERAGGPQKSAFSPLGLAEFGPGGRSVAGGAEGCCVGRTWHGRVAERGRVLRGKAGCPPGILKPA